MSKLISNLNLERALTSCHSNSVFARNSHNLCSHLNHFTIHALSLLIPTALPLALFFAALPIILARTALPLILAVMLKNN